MSTRLHLDRSKLMSPMAMLSISLLNRVCSPDASVDDIVCLVETDQVLAVRVLRWANSRRSGDGKPITGIPEAIIELGVDNLLKLTVGSALAESMQMPLPEYGLGQSELWNHHLASALALECLNAINPETFHPAGITIALIHDVGKLFLAEHLTPGMVADIQRIVREENRDYFEAEKDVAGMNHAEAGGEIARSWHLPEPLIFLIENHHDPKPSQDVLLNSLQLANTVSKIVGVGLGNEQVNITTSPGILQRLKLTTADLEAMCASVQDRLAGAGKPWERIMQPERRDRSCRGKERDHEL